MDIFLVILTNMIPLYVLIGIGYLAGKFFEIDRASIGTITIFVFLPIVMFGFVVNMDYKPEYLALPVIVFLVTTSVALIGLKIGQKLYTDGRANLLSMCCAWGNTGYFALPLTLLFFTPAQVAIYIFMMAGAAIFEGTVGYYILMRGNFTVAESLRRLARFPSLYAIVLAVLYNLSGLETHPIFEQYQTHFKGGYIVLGMMLIGLSLSRVKRLVIAPKFITFSFLGKFVLWPLLALACIEFDRNVTKLFDTGIYQLFMIMATVPQGANIAAYATQLNLKPEKAATTVLLGTLFALIYVPVVYMLIGLH